jgi:NADH dehydrogenase (ubiquinone) 1 beta subcomplex subunit 7
MVATQKDMQDAKIDLAHRDFCAHLLIPLNECRKAEYYIPWKCGHERHAYEKCQYKECVAGAPPDRSRAVDRASERINQSLTTTAIDRTPRRHRASSDVPAFTFPSRRSSRFLLAGT